MLAVVMVAAVGHSSCPGLLSATAHHPMCCLPLFPLADPSPSAPPASCPSQGTTYQKTDATVEMKRLNREQFWEQAKVRYRGGSSPWSLKERDEPPTG